MNKPKLSFTAVSRFFLNVCTVLVLVVLASLIGVGGAALWIYNRPETVSTTAKHSLRSIQSDVAASESRSFPKLAPMSADSDVPAQLIPAHYVPSDSEIATFSGSPRYTYVSYNGGRQQAHLRVNTVVGEVAPAPLAASVTTDDISVQSNDRPLLTDSGSRYITNAQGRVIGIDGTQAPTVRALPAQSAGVEPEVRVAAPVVTRKALPVDDNQSDVPTTPSTFDVRAELARQDDRPVLRVQPVTRSTGNIRPSMFGASDDYHSFGRN